MTNLLRIAIVGAGFHAIEHHIPSLRDLAQAGRAVTVSAVCDRDASRAAAAAAPWNAHATPVLDDLPSLADAAIVCLPSSATPVVALSLSARGMPLLIEKPLAPTLAQAEALVAGIHGPAMVSLNRRFNAGLRAARRWLGDRPIRSVTAAMERTDRKEPSFLAETGLHLVDAVASLVGIIEETASRRHLGLEDHLRWTGSAGASVEVRIAPRSGREREWIDLEGDGWEARIDLAQSSFSGHDAFGDAGWTLPASVPLHQRSGTDAETEAFVDALAGNAPWYPSLADALASTRLTHLPI